MIYILQNFIPILAATVVSFLAGAGWYRAFGKPWVAATGLTREKMAQLGRAPSPWPFVIAFVAEFWICSIIAGALILAPEEAGEWTMAVGTAFILWVGFVFPVILVNDRYEFRPLKLTAINSGHWLAVFILQAIVLELIGLTSPTSTSS